MINAKLDLGLTIPWSMQMNFTFLIVQFQYGFTFITISIKKNMQKEIIWDYNSLLSCVKLRNLKKQIKQGPNVNVYKKVSGSYKSDIINIEPI